MTNFVGRPGLGSAQAGDSGAAVLYSATSMILAAGQFYFWYFGNPTLLAPVEDRSA